MSSAGKGGARHTPKPQDLLVKCFTLHSALIQHCDPYEHISKTQAWNPKGLFLMLPLLKGLLDLEATCEIHGSCLRQAIFQVLVQDPSLNDSKFNGSVWVGSRVERISVVLFHMRRLKGSDDMKACASRLTGAEFLQLQEVVDMIAKKGPPSTELALVALGKREDGEQEPAIRKLKKEVSDVSLDSQGFPKSLKTPEKVETPLLKGCKPGDKLPLLKGDTSEAEPVEGEPLAEPSFKRRRKGQLAERQPTEEEKSNMKDALGLGKVYKRPAGQKKKTSKASVSKAGSSKASSPLVKGKKKIANPNRKPWLKLYMTQTKKPPWRAYLTGTTQKGGKKSLIVELYSSM